MAAISSQTPQRSEGHGSKRKRGRADDGNLSEQTALKPQKKRSAAGGDVDQLIGHMNPGLITDHIAKKIKRSFRDLSTVELEDKYLSQSIFFDTSDFELLRELDNLPSFMERYSASARDLSTSSEEPGSPHTLVITASGLRAANVTRSLRQYQSPESAVAKLFAKHIKFPEAVQYVKRTRIGIGIGTPQRLLDLLEKNVMTTLNLKRIVIDASHLDQKKRSIFDMKELLDPLVRLLSTHLILDRLEAGDKRTRVYVF